MTVYLDFENDRLDIRDDGGTDEYEIEIIRIKPDGMTETLEKESEESGEKSRRISTNGRNKLNLSDNIKRGNMKTINYGLIIIALVIIGLSTAAQAQINRTAIGGNKHCPNSNNLLTDAEIDSILESHNAARREVGLEPLKWNCALADFGQKWANSDTGVHSAAEQRKDIFSNSGASGENLAHAYDSETQTPVQTMIQGWIDEKQFLQSDRKTCTANPKNIPCGHYTQMVWRNSTAVGCGINRQSHSFSEDSKGKASYLVCVYNPAGNFDGEAAY